VSFRALLTWTVPQGRKLWNATSIPFYYGLIDESGKFPGVPVVMNTSFNLRGEAIVHTPTDAIRTFFSSGMDALIMGNFLVEK